MSEVAFPYQFDGRGRTASVDDDRHVRDLILQTLLTAPGERVMRPDFGSGVLQLVFEGNSPELAATVQFLVQGALTHWLTDRITVEAVEVEAREATLEIEVRYVNLRTQAREVTRLTAPGGTP